MFNKILMIFLILSSPVQAQVLSGHQEFVHYTEDQKQEFVVKVMELMVELENKYEKAPLEEKKKYSQILEQLRHIMISSAYAAETDLSVFAKDLTTLLDPSNPDDKRCIYAGWVSRTVSMMDHKTGAKEVCQHPKFIKNGGNGAEAKAYSKSSSCGKQNQNTIACNPAIFGFKNQEQGSQFCVPAGPAHSDNSSYACMQLALGLKKEAGADPADKRLAFVKKQFEGNPTLVNNLYGFIYKTCICDTQEVEVINQSYLNKTRPHRTCLGLINSIAETNHCVEFSAAKSSEMELFKGIRSFTNEIAGKSIGTQVDQKYKELLYSLKDRFSSDYAHICGGEIPPQTGGDNSGDGDGDGDAGKTCSGECDLEDGKLVNCLFTDESGEKLEVDFQNDGPREFPYKIGEDTYLCKVSERAFDHQAKCSLEVKEDKVALNFSFSKDQPADLKATHWSPSQEGAEGIVEEVSFGDNKEIALKIDIEVKGKPFNLDCGSAKNPKDNKAPKIDIIDDGGDNSTQKFSTKTDPENPEGWKYKWTRKKGPKKKQKEPETKFAKDSDDEGNKEVEQKEPEPKDEYEDLANDGKTYNAPKEKEPYDVCVELVKGEEKSNRACHPVAPIKDKKEEAPKPTVGGPQLPQMQTPMRRGVDFSRGGVL